jgi:UDP-N-acetylmuramate dehydrogenase
MEESASSSICPIRHEVPGAKVTTYNIGGPIRDLFEPNSREELQALVKFLYSERRLFKILGGGSNLLIPSQGIEEPVIRLGNGFKYWENQGGGVIKVGASMPLIRLSQETAQAGLSGLEFAGGIPASVGGAVRMNAGAHGGDISQILDRITILTYDGVFEDVAANHLDYGYRRSNIGGLGIVVSATLKMASGDKEKILDLRAKNLSHHHPISRLYIQESWLRYYRWNYN